MHKSLEYSASKASSSDNPHAAKSQMHLPFQKLWQRVDKLRTKRRSMLKDIVTLRLWRNGRRAVMMLSLLVGMAATSTAGCAGGPPSEEITAPADSLAATVTSIPADTDTPARTAVPSPTFVPTHSPTGELSPAGVYERVAPSVAFIETPRATGSGVLIRDGYVITNYHVVWPYGSVQVVFPDGTELEDVPIVGWDPMVDLAVLGPVDVSAHPLPLRDAEKDSALGSELFLIGYPAEVELLPKPTITSGILSRTREWERPGITYFQTDAAIEGGQSGGALVNSRGLVVGISTFWFSDAGFALAASSADVIPIVEQLIQGEFRSGLGARRLPLGRGNFEFSLDLRNPWEARDFLLDGPAGTMLQVEIEGPGDGWFRVSDVFETILGVNDGLTGAESGAVELSTGGIHILQVGLDWGDPSRFSLSSNLRLRPLNDPDDGRLVTVGETVAASLDHFSDWDWYSIRLKEGETVRISTDSFNVDTLIAVDFPDSRRNQVVSDDDGGGGLFGLNSELVYRAPHSGEYIIAVTDAAGENFGGYYLSVASAAPGTERLLCPLAPKWWTAGSARCWFSIVPRAISRYRCPKPGLSWSWTRRAIRSSPLTTRERTATFSLSRKTFFPWAGASCL